MAKCNSGRMREQFAGRGVREENLVALPQDVFQNVETRMIDDD